MHIIYIYILDEVEDDTIWKLGCYVLITIDTFGSLQWLATYCFAIFLNCVLHLIFLFVLL
jgi:hypothetical protein